MTRLGLRLGLLLALASNAPVISARAQGAAKPQQPPATQAQPRTVTCTVDVSPKTLSAPLGDALGRSLWDLFAREINAVPDPSTPFVSVALIAVGALVVANLVAAVPGRIAARTHTAHAFRTE